MWSQPRDKQLDRRLDARLRCVGSDPGMRTLTSAASARGLAAALLAVTTALTALPVAASVTVLSSAAGEVPFWHFTVTGADDGASSFTQVGTLIVVDGAFKRTRRACSNRPPDVVSSTYAF